MIRRVGACALFLAVAVAIAAGCGGNQPAEEPPATPAATNPTPAAPGVTLPAGMDDGPRAGTVEVDGGKASAGEKLFQSKGCPVCHGFGKKITCPDLVGVSMRRTALWMENQILHPEVMVKQDPIAMALKKDYALPMTNQGLTPEEARAVIEFLKRKDKQAGATH